MIVNVKVKIEICTLFAPFPPIDGQFGPWHSIVSEIENENDDKKE